MILDGTGCCTATGCREPAIDGGSVCPGHGGSAPQVQTAAARRLEEREAARLVAACWPVDPVDPVAALADLARRTEAWHARAGELIRSAAGAEA